MIIVNQINLCPCDPELISVIKAQKMYSPEFHRAAIKATPEWSIDEEHRWTLKCPICGISTKPDKNQLKVREEWNEIAAAEWVMLELLREN